MDFQFTLQSLKQFLQHAKKHVQIVPMQEYKVHRGKIAILRHDVDLDICPAFTVADLEESIGIRSTFFVRVDGPTYNLFNPKIRQNLVRLADRGFEIGLHFDPTQANTEKKQQTMALDAKFKVDLRLLETALSRRVSSFSLHNPVQHGFVLPETKLINAYDPEIFSDERYISDSLFVDPSFHLFRGKNPYEFVANAKKYPLQIVFHPEQFFSEDEAYLQAGNYLGSIVRFLGDTRKEVFDQYQQTITMLRNIERSKRRK